MSLRYLLVCSVFDEKSAINFLSLFLFVMLVVFKYYLYCCCSVAKSCLSLRPHELQHARLPCPSLSPLICSNSCPLSHWCHPIILSSVTPFSSWPQSFPTSGSFPISWLFASGGQSTGASALASVLPMNIQGWFLLGFTGLMFWLSKGLSRIFSSFMPDQGWILVPIPRIEPVPPALQGRFLTTGSPGNTSKEPTH